MKETVTWEPLSRYFPDRVLPSQCPTRIVLDHVTSRWGVLILVSLAEEALRWSELHRRVEGVSEKMLAQTLRILQEDGLVHREVQPNTPPTVEYSLTELGRELVVRLLPLFEWIAANADTIVGGMEASAGSTN
jgi:DNA-binding HxlR family transcriptional regulator